MNFCTECGKFIKNQKNQYCTHCGALLVLKEKPVKEEPKKQQPTRTTVKTKTSNTKNNKSSKGSGKAGAILWLACIVIMIVILVGRHIGVTPETLSQVTGKVSAEDIVEKAYNERDRLVTISVKDLNKTYGTIETSYYAIHDLLLLNPEHYLLDYQNCTYSNIDNGNTLEFHLNYFDELDSDATRLMIDLKAQEILDQVPEDANQWETAKIIHDELIKRVTYEDTMYDSTIYGTLVNNKAVCCGIAVTYEYLLEKAGISCDTMAGYVVDETRTDFGSITDSSLANMYGKHAWNVVTLTDPNGTPKSYIVDVTWDNTDSYTDSGNEYISHSWFLLSLSDFRETGRLPYPNFNYDNWDFSSRASNYYVLYDAIITEYDINKIADALQRQLDDGYNILSVCWDDTARYLEAKEKITSGDISKIIKRIDSGKYTYSMTEDRYTSGKYCLNVYVND